MRHRRRRSKRRALVAATVVVVVLAGVLVWYLTRTTGPPPYTLDVKPGYTVAEVANQLGRAHRDIVRQGLPHGAVAVPAVR